MVILTGPIIRWDFDVGSAGRFKQLLYLCLFGSCHLGCNFPDSSHVWNGPLPVIYFNTAILTEPMGFYWRDSSTNVHLTNKVHRLWLAHLLRSSRYGHAAQRPQLFKSLNGLVFSRHFVSKDTQSDALFYLFF